MRTSRLSTNYPKKCVKSQTFQADGLEIGDPGAGTQVKQVVLRVVDEGLALVAVVIHVEGLWHDLSIDLHSVLNSHN